MIDDAERVQALAQYLLRESYVTSDMDAVLTALGMLAELAGGGRASGGLLDPGDPREARGLHNAGRSASDGGGRPTGTSAWATHGA